jgi:hypothetical protein
LKKLNIEKIRIDGGTQSRAKIDNKLIKEYAEAMKNGDKFPAIVVFYDEHDYWLADGFQRYEAYMINNIDKINCEIINGSKRDAILFSVGANATHGQRRTNADKHKAVITLLEDEEWQTWSDAIIAEKCGVSGQTVYNIRKDEYPSTLKILTSKGKDGRTYKKKQNKKPKPEIEVEIEESENITNENIEEIETEEDASDQNVPEEQSIDEEENDSENVENNEEEKPKHKKKKSDYQLRREAAYDMIVTFLESLPPKIQKREKKAMIEWLTNYPKELN